MVSHSIAAVRKPAPLFRRLREGAELSRPAGSLVRCQLSLTAYAQLPVPCPSWVLFSRRSTAGRLELQAGKAAPTGPQGGGFAEAL